MKLLRVTSFYPSIDKLSVDNSIVFNPGINDRLDQYICLVGRFAGFNTFLFQHEIGDRRSVTEILDMRDNPHHYLHQAPPQTPQFERVIKPTPKLGTGGFVNVARWNDPYLATVWFPSDGVLIGRSGKLFNDTRKARELIAPDLNYRQLASQRPAPVTSMPEVVSESPAIKTRKYKFEIDTSLSTLNYVKSVEFYTRYGDNNWIIEFDNPVTEKEAIKAVEKFLSQPMTQQYYDEWSDLPPDYSYDKLVEDLGD